MLFDIDLYILQMIIELYILCQYSELDILYIYLKDYGFLKWCSFLYMECRD